MSTAVFKEASNLPELLRRRARELGDAPFVRMNDQRLSYAEFDARTDQIAAGLADLGVKKGDAVSIFLPNQIEFLEAWWGCLKVGATFGPVNAMFTASEAAFVINDLESVLLIGNAKSCELVNTKRGDLPKLQNLVSVDGGLDDIIAFDDLRTKGDTPPDVTIEPETLASVLYTSGTTGRPKGAMVTHKATISDVEQVAELVPARRGDTFGMILPLFHANAQIATCVTPMFLGANIAMWERFSAKDFWEQVADYQPITFSAVPTILSALLHAPGADDADTSSLEYVICGAAALNRDLFVRFEEKFNLRILEGYGLTESTCVSTINPFWGPRKVGSIGLPLRGQEIRIANPDTQEPVPQGETGEVLIKGDNIMTGYYNLPEETEKALRNGFLHTGDVAYADEDGFIFLVDRVKDMIIRGGENIYPREIEEVLSTHADVREVAVIGRPHEHRGEEVHAVVVLVDGATATEDDLRAHCAENLARYKTPTTYEFMDELPKNATGKIDKKPLRAALAEA